MSGHKVRFCAFALVLILVSIQVHVPVSVQVLLPIARPLPLNLAFLFLFFLFCFLVLFLSLCLSLLCTHKHEPAGIEQQYFQKLKSTMLPNAPTSQIPPQNFPKTSTSRMHVTLGKEKKKTLRAKTSPYPKAAQNILK